MSKRWTTEEDAFLLRWHGIIGGADYVASHEFGRPHGAGTRRLDALTKSGARLEFALASLHRLEFEKLAGRSGDFSNGELRHWENEFAAAQQLDESSHE